MAIHKLTVPKINARIKQIADLSFGPNAKTALVGDGQGLYLSISKKGTASWLFRYMDYGKAKSIGLGSYPSTSLQKAREKAQSYRDSRTVGVDPALAKKEEAQEQKLQVGKSMTFESCAEEFIEMSRPSWRNEKHGDQWTNTLKAYAHEVIGTKTVGEIDTDDIIKILNPIWTTKSETASRVRGRIESVLDWATVKNWRKGDNPARFKGHLEYLLPKPKAKPQKHHAALPYKSLPGLVKALQGQVGMARYALEFLILCCSRTGEVIAAQWSEIDLDQKIWTIPGERMKANETHRVPLGERAIEILNTVKPFSGKKYVFKTARRKDVAMSSGAMSMLLKTRMKIKGATVHGLRSTFRDWAAEQTDYPMEVCEQALAHGLRDDVAAAYLRSDFFAKRVKLMQDWEVFVLSECGT